MDTYKELEEEEDFETKRKKQEELDIYRNLSDGIIVI